jgi:hypothetical protein
MPCANSLATVQLTEKDDADKASFRAMYNAISAHNYKLAAHNHKLTAENERLFGENCRLASLYMNERLRTS